MQIKRDKYLNILVDKLGNNSVKVVTGIRRCGKSYLLFDIFKEYLLAHGYAKENIVELVFDEYGSAKYRDPDIFYPWIQKQLKDGGNYIVLLDEIQLLKDFESVLIGLMRIPNVDVYVTGSNAKLLSKDIITEFRGRGEEIKMQPLSFAEYSDALNSSSRETYNRFLTYGGLPATVELADEKKEEYLKQIFDEIYINDVIERNNLKSPQNMSVLLDVLSSDISCLTNSKKIADTFKSNGYAVSSETVSSYIEALKDAFIINEAKRFDIKGRKYIGAPVKYYFCDIGLRNARLNFRQSENPHILENVIYDEIIGRGFNVDVGLVKNYYKDNNGSNRAGWNEVDFVANKASKRVYIQCTMSLRDEDKRRQELRSLKAISDSFTKIVVVDDEIVSHYDDNGIFYVSAQEFLLNEAII